MTKIEDFMKYVDSVLFENTIVPRMMLGAGVTSTSPSMNYFPTELLQHLCTNESKKTTIITDEMLDHFRTRTLLHIKLVQKYLERIILLFDSRLDRSILAAEMNHDQSKFEEPEYSAYLHIDWDYYQKSLGKTYSPGKEIEDQMEKASSHHVHGNMHHPEYWVIDNSNSNILDATCMPFSYVASMVADWCAMSEELKNSPVDWADKNVNVKWKFTCEQVRLIYDLFDRVWDSNTIL